MPPDHEIEPIVDRISPGEDRGRDTSSSARGIDHVSLREFDPVYYLSKYSDVLSAYGDNHLGAAIHFMEYGVNELRSPSPFFDPRYYRDMHRDLRDLDGKQLLDHWHRYGIGWGRRSCSAFNLSFYLEHYSDLSQAFGNDHEAAFAHWRTHGHRERRLTAPGKRTQLIWGDTRSADDSYELADGSGRCYERERAAEELLGPGTVLKKACKVFRHPAAQLACKVLLKYGFRETNDNEWIIMECEDQSQLRVRRDPIFRGDINIPEEMTRLA